MIAIGAPPSPAGNRRYSVKYIVHAAVICLMSSLASVFLPAFMTPRIAGTMIAIRIPSKVITTNISTKVNPSFLFI